MEFRTKTEWERGSTMYSYIRMLYGLCLANAWQRKSDFKFRLVTHMDKIPSHCSLMQAKRTWQSQCSALCILVSSADNICKQFGLSSDPTRRRAWYGSKLFDTQIVFLKDFFFEKSWFWKKSANDKNMKNYPVGKELNEVLREASRSNKGKLIIKM